MAGSMRTPPTALAACESSAQPYRHPNYVAGSTRLPPASLAARTSLAVRRPLPPKRVPTKALRPEEVYQGAILYLSSKDDVEGLGITNARNGKGVHPRAYNHPILVVSMPASTGHAGSFDCMTASCSELEQ